MASSRDSSRDRDSRALKHQHSLSFSDSGRTSVPMWDSSDPDRAPPPLPLNPGSSSPAIRPNTSARIEEAAALITGRARENAPSGYTTNAMPNASPEKSLIKPHHKRMQSIQSGTVKNLSDSLERRSPEKSLRASVIPEHEAYESRPLERSPTRSGSETPTPRGRATPDYLNKPILGENTPPSATMLALQNMRSRVESEAPLSNITNNSSALIRTPQTFDAISSQILSLTSIATNLQREMAQLSRRSKDNATDLISLKEATNSRDEDIRTCLKELVSGLDTKFHSSSGISRSAPSLGFYLESKAHGGSPRSKTINLPRVPSPTTFSVAEITASPSVVSSDGVASIALLEKVLREMGTKDGQEKIVKILESAKSQSVTSPTVIDPAIMAKFDELLQLMKENSGSRALVRSHGGGSIHGASLREEDFDGSRSGPLLRTAHDMATVAAVAAADKTKQHDQASEFVNDEIMKLLKNIKQSISQGGGLTNEVKALVRELRGEVLGMGRDMARKIEQAESSRKVMSSDSQETSPEEIAQIVENGLNDLKEHMDRLIRENRRQSSASMRSFVDPQEVYTAVRTALAELPRPREEPERDPELEREKLLQAIREAWEDCKPEIALEHFGLERDEILETLKEGLKSYQPQQTQIREVGASYEEVLEAVQRGMATFKAPIIDTEATITREEILVTVRECLESFEFPMPTLHPLAVRHSDLTRSDVVEAVKEGLLTQSAITKEFEFNREDLFDAVNAAVERRPSSLGDVGGQVLEQMHEFLETMKREFQSYSAANGKDTEQVLDAMKDGLEELRADIETYVDRAADVTGKDEIIDTVKDGFRNMQADLGAGFANHSGSRDVVVDTSELLDAIEKGFRVMQVDLEKGLAHHSESKGMAETPEFLEIMEKEFDDLRDSLAKSLVRSDNSGEIIDTVRDGFRDVQAELTKGFVNQSGSRDGADAPELLDTMEKEFELLRDSIATSMVRVSGSEEIIDAIKDGFRDMRADLEKGFANQSGSRGMVDTPELLDAMEKEFEHLRETITKSLVRSSGSTDKDEILDAIHDISEGDRRSGVSSNTSTEDIARLVKEELEHIRTVLAGALVRTGSTVDREEILDAIREGLEAHRDSRKVEGGESVLSNSSELLDAFQEGVDGLRSDMERIMNRPVDLSTSYEILDTLKAGLESVRSDIERLHESHRDLSETATARGGEVIIHDENLISTEIEGLKVMITQLRIKVEALDSMPPPPFPVPASQPIYNEDQLHKDDLVDIHAAIKEVHHSINSFGNDREGPPSTEAAKKEDTDAIETLLRNVKSRLEEFSFPEPDSIAKSVDVESLEDLLKEMKDSIEESAIRAEARSVSKEDFGIVETLLNEVASGVEDLQSKTQKPAADEDRVTKLDIQVIETLCLDTKTQIDELVLPEVDTLPTKDDIGGIHDAIRAFQEQIEAENELTAQAFEARKIEHGGLANKIEEVKGVLGDLRGELTSKLDGSEEGLVELVRLVETQQKSLDTYATATSLHELVELVNNEFERHHDLHNATKLETEGRDAALIVKHEETRAAVASELSAKIEEKFDELVRKYDDAQLSNENKMKAFETRDGQNLETMISTKSVFNDLRILIETLGTTVTETCDRMSDDARTVFNRVDEANTKLDGLHTTSLAEHSLTRHEVAKTLNAAIRLEGTLGEHQPMLMNAIKEILGIVAQHHEQSQQQTEHLQQQADYLSRVTAEIKIGVDAIPSVIPPLLPALPPVPMSPPLISGVPVQKEYDDTQVHDKLNALLNHATGAREAFARMDDHANSTEASLANMDKLEKIHEQITATAEEVSAMVATQTRLMAEHHESRAAEAAETAIALEKRMAQKELVEAEIIVLSEEKELLLASRAALRREQEELAGQTKRLTREVAKLETALNLRQEEMRDMEARAENLERRILEGVMDHARSRHMAKPGHRTKSAAAERDASMNLKRVPSSASTITTKTSIKDGNSALGNAVGVVLRRRTPLGSGTGSEVSSRPSVADRRILSTSHLTGNRGRGLSNHPSKALMLAPTPSTSLVNLKRSHSVKSNPSSYYGGRKASWNGTSTHQSSNLGDKENHALDEEDEDENRSEGEETMDSKSERRTSLSGTSGTYTDSLMYGTGSSLSRNSSGRTVSYASSVGGAIGLNSASIAEEDENEEEEDGDGNNAMHGTEENSDSAKILALLEPPSSTQDGNEEEAVALAEAEPLDAVSDLEASKLAPGGMVVYNQPSDSGLGTEPPTANIQHMGLAKGYFDTSNQDLGI